MIEKCKICGKLPKVIYNENGNCVVICKPLFKHAHWMVEAPNKEYAVNRWNNRMQNFETIKTTFRRSFT